MDFYNIGILEKSKKKKACKKEESKHVNTYL